MNMKKASERMAACRLDAVLLAAPENVTYVTGFSSLMGGMWYEAGIPTTWALVPAAGERPAMLVAENEVDAARALSGIADVRGYPLWIDLDSVVGESPSASEITVILRESRSGRLKPDRRPGFFEPDAILGLLTDMLRARRLLDGRIGLDLDFVSHGAFTRLQAALPRVTFIDASPLLRDLRAIKSPDEVAQMHTAVWVAEQAILTAVDGVSEATRHGDVRLRFEIGAAQAAQRRGVSGFRGAAANVRIGPRPWISTPEATVRSGDLIMFDCGANVLGWHSDMGRTFVYARATEAQMRIQSALMRAHDAALARARPGNRVCDIFRAGMDAMHAAGFPTYRRGHLGHSIGLDALEETPVINEAETRVLEPGMVLAVEVPWYIDGIGGFQCENVIHVTETGCEDLNTLTRELVVV